MKIILYLLFILTLTISCRKDVGTAPINEKVDLVPSTIPIANKVLILKIDYLTYSFEGGYELPFYDTTTFNISSTYNPPGDFGDIQLYYEEFNALLFDGTIIWMGTGAQSYPAITQPAIEFEVNNQYIQMPTYSTFEAVKYSNYQTTIADSEYDQIWSAVANLKLVENYRNSNPTGTIFTFLYTPSVGMGNPAEWDWYIFLKN